MCLNPRFINTPSGESRAVPCGHCLQCLKAYQDSWCARLNEELKQWNDVDGHKPCIFFTLDYRPEAVPCSYLVLSRNGVRVSEIKPNCEILPFWTDTTHESRRKWLSRRVEILRRYWRTMNLIWSLRDCKATIEDIFDGNYKTCNSDFCIAPDFYLHDLPQFDVDFFSFSDSGLKHPRFDSTHVLRDYSGFTHDDILALEFHSVSKPDVQCWLKRCRRQLEYHLPDIFAQKVNPRLITTWTDSSGDEFPMPSSSLTNTFKYFITSEYGPKTFRPHYHGVLFGVSYEEFRDYFVRDWEKNFGRVDFSLLRSSGGALLYVAKYCSKGEYEHPYCRRDYFYNKAEFHSRRFEDSILDFGLDVALVNSTFHLVSKGLGISYCFNKEIQEYMGVQLSQYLTDSGKVRYCSFDNVGFVPDTPFDVLFPQFEGKPLYNSFEFVWHEHELVINKYVDKEHKYLLSSSSIPYDAVVSSALESVFFNKKYNRTYVTSKRPSSVINPKKWQFGDVGCVVEKKTTSISIPRYYSKVLVSPLVSLFRQSAALKLPADWHVQAAEIIRKDGFSDEVLRSIVSFRTGAEIVQASTHSRLQRSAEHFISNSKF